MVVVMKALRGEGKKRNRIKQSEILLSSLPETSLSKQIGGEKRRIPPFETMTWDSSKTLSVIFVLTRPPPPFGYTLLAYFLVPYPPSSSWFSCCVFSSSNQVVCVRVCLCVSLSVPEPGDIVLSQIFCVRQLVTTRSLS